MKRIDARGRRLMTSLTLASSLAWMTIVPAATALAASAPTVVPGSVALTGPTASSAGGSVTFTATAQDPGGTPEYQFWVEEPNGQWVDAQNYSTRSTFVLGTPTSGDYLVAVEVLDMAQVAAGDWAAAATTLPDAVFVGASVSVQVAAGAGAALGTPVTLKASAQNIFDPLYQFWVEDPSGQWHQSGAYQTADAWRFTPTQEGTYRFVAYAKSPLAANNPHGALQSPVEATAEYGGAAQVALTPAHQSVVADGTASVPVDVAVEDAAGTPVEDYSGTVMLTAPGLFSAAKVSLTSGVGVYALEMSPAAAGGTYTITADQLVASAGDGGSTVPNQGANIRYGSATVSGTVPTAASLLLTATPTGLSVDQQNAATVTVTVLDQAGDPWKTSTGIYGTLTLSGPGSFAPGAGPALLAESFQIGANASTAVASVYDEQGSSGTITVAATTSNSVAPASPITITTYGTGAPARLAISSAAVAGGELYTAMVEDAQGHLITAGTGAHDTISLSYSANPSLDITLVSGTNVSQQGETFTAMASAGEVTWEVSNQAAGSGPVTLAFVDQTAQLSATATYTYELGQPDYAEVVPNGDYQYNVRPGGTITITAQLTDQYGNPVQVADQPIWFTLTGAPTAGEFMLPNGASTVGATYEAFTNAMGIATVTLTATTTAPPADLSLGDLPYVVVQVAGRGGPLSPEDDSPPVYVVNPANYTTHLTSTLTGGRVDGGAIVTGEVFGWNALNAPAALGQDVVNITSSNPSVISVDYPDVQLSDATAYLPDLFAHSVGTATITLQDVSVPSVPPITVTYTVVPGLPAQNAALFTATGPVDSSNPVTLSAGHLQELWVKNVDGGGNVIPVLANRPLLVNLPPLAGAEWATSSAGPFTAETVVSIPSGASSAPVWVEATGSVSLTSSDAMDAAQFLSWAPTAGGTPTTSMSTALTSSTWSAAPTLYGYTLFGQPVSSGDPVWMQYGAGGTGTQTTVNGLAISSTPVAVAANYAGQFEVSVASATATGTATLSAADEPQNPDASATLTVDVTSLPPEATNAQLFDAQGPVSSQNYVSMSAGQIEELWVKNVNAAGTVIPVPGTKALVVNLPALSGAQWATTAATGPYAAQAFVTIPAGASSAPVWVEATGTVLLTSSDVMDAAQKLDWQLSGLEVSSASLSASLPLVVPLLGFTLFGNPVSSGDPVWLSLSGSGASVSGTAIASAPTEFYMGGGGQITLTVGGGNGTVTATDEAPPNATATATLGFSIG